MPLPLPLPPPATPSPPASPRPSWAERLGPVYRPMTGVLTRPALLVPVVLLFAMVWLNLGSDYGLAKQVFHENPLLQFAIGLGASAVLLQVCVVAYLLDARKRWLIELPSRPGSHGHRVDRQMRWYLDLTWLPLVAGVTARALYDILIWLDYAGWLPFVDLIHGTAAPKPLARLPFALGVAAPLVLYFPWRFLRRVREETAAALALYAPDNQQPTISLREVFYHVSLGAAGLGLTWFVVPQARLEWLTLTLTTWLALHGLVLFRFRMPDRREERDAYRVHRRLGFFVGGVFVFYQVLFGLFCLDLWHVPPALITFLMLYLFVTIHGFLAYHFRGWYFAAVAGLVALVALINGDLLGVRPPYPLRFSGLGYNHPAELIEVDFEGLYAKLLKRTSDLEQDPGSAEKTNKVMASYYRLIEAHRGLELRWRARLEQGGKPPPPRGVADDLPGPEVTAAALAAGRFAEVYDTYARWRAATDEVGNQLARLEYDGLEAWRDQAAPAGQKPKLVLVAVSGGANRSALWSTFVLDRLEREMARENVHFPRHVRLVTGASGGMVGASYWVATLGEKGHDHADSEAFVDRVASDSLTRLTNHALFLDLPSLLLPGPFQADRGVALEQAWKENLGGALDRPVRDLAAGEARGWRPSLVYSPMLVEDGRRLLISNLYLPFLAETAGQALADPGDREAKPGAHHARTPRPAGKPIRYDPEMSCEELAYTRRDRYSVSAVEFFQLFPRADEFKVSTAVRMSATFPYFSPAVDLPTEPRRRVVDAGYYDNYGVDVAAGWLYQYRRWLAQNTSGVVLIQVRDSVSERGKLFPDERQPMWRYSRSLEWATGPLVGVGSARAASMSFRNDEMVQVLSDYFNRHGKPMFTTVVFEAPGDVAMSWYLTREEVAHLKGGFDVGDGTASANHKSLGRLAKWWKGNHSRPEPRADGRER